MIGLLKRNRRHVQRSQKNTERVARNHQTIRNRLEKSTHRAATGVLDDVAKSVVRKFERSRGNASVEDLFEPEEWRDQFNTALVPNWSQIIWTGIEFEQNWIESLTGADESQALSQEILEILEGDPPASIHVDPDDALKARVRRWLRGRTVGVWSRVGETTEKQIRKILNKGIRDGLTFKQQGKLLAKELNGYKAWQGRRIARTEATGGINYGGQLERAHLEIAEKIWIMRQDVKVRKPPKSVFDHWKAHRQVVANSEPFIVSGEQLLYPGDPNGSAGNVINCRCSGLSHFSDAPRKSTRSRTRESD